MRNYPLYEVDIVTNLKDLVSNAVLKYRKKEVFGWFEGEVTTSRTYEQFQQDINALGTALYNLGYLPVVDKKEGLLSNLPIIGGEKETLPPRIALIGENSYDWIVSYFAIVNGGNVVVPIDKDLPQDNIRNIIKESGASAVIYSDEYAHTFDNFFKKFKVKNLKTFINMRYDMPGVIAKGRELLAEGETAYLDYEIDEDRTTAIIFTSGTTGLAKGVELHHKGLTYNIVHGNRLGLMSGDTVLLLPLHHTYGFGATIISTLLRGYKCFINSNLKNVLRDIKEARPQFLCVVPLYIESFWKNISSNIKKQGKEKLIERMVKVCNGTRKIGIDLRRIVFKQILDAFGGKLELLVSGAAPLDASMIAKFNNFGIAIVEGYGITECSPGVSFNRNKYWKAGSVGLPVP
ncbi:MAG: AMP-binding protein, partial [Oscillospiraceae bacterium]|nr:AMP-binding protein [Oscillospiraceae bacterium]